MKKAAVITGGSSGIGKSAARLFAKKGYSVLITGTDEAKLNGVREEFLSEGLSVDICRADVSQEAEVIAIADRVSSSYGGCDVLVNNAGAFKGGLLHEADTADYDILFDVNVKGVYFMMKYFMPLLIKQRGCIVNVASICGMNGDYNMPLYCASKAAVISLTKSAALDYGKAGVRINSVSPSATKTPMFLNGSQQDVIDAFEDATPDGRIGLPEEVAEAIYFFASEGASHITGQNIAVDGGISAWTGQPKQDKEK